MNKSGKFSLLFKDAEGGDFPRIYSKYHGHEFFAHKDWKIMEYLPAFIKYFDDGGFEIKVEGMKNSIFVPKWNVIWYCNECSSQFPCTKYYPLPPESCKDCLNDQIESE